MVIRHTLLLLTLSSLLAACSSTQPKVAAPTAQAPNTRAISLANQKPDDNATSGNISISDEVQKACGLAKSEAHFAFDSSQVRGQDRKVLRTLADCFISGPLKGRQMSLIGHADPRGTQDYNMALAGKRADNVKGILVAENMKANRVSTTSRGALDATGTDEVSWAKDRSVDVTLGS